MSETLISLQDLEFLLFDVYNAESLTSYSRFEDHSRETIESMLHTAYAVAKEHFEPLAEVMDAQEPSFDGERVNMPNGLTEALKQYYESGFIAATQDYEVGGVQAPLLVSIAAKMLFSAANVSLLAYPMLSSANANVIKNFGTDVQKSLYLEALMQGRFTGTMALTEPQAGSSLSDIKTSATQQSDGSWLLRGHKVFISGGDHELSDNIIHLVLSRTEGAPAGVKGLSLFIVPKYNVNDDGSLGDRNDVALAGLIHKMGYRGTTSTMLNFGENQGARASLIGEEGKGLLYMFQMMNEARIGVGSGAVALGYSGYQHALNYSKERFQGRHPQDKNPSSSQVALIEHADVRRMLLQMKSYVEGGLSLSLFGASLVDQRYCDDERVRERSAAILDVLTPVMKSWPSKYCLKANDIAIQIHGGYGYTREYPLERLYRDNRLNPIHEGTEGIQGMDLLGRKVTMKNGQPFLWLCEDIRQTIEETAAQESVVEFSEKLGLHLEALIQCTDTLKALASSHDANRYLANATLYLDVFGQVIVAWLWLKQASAAMQVIDETPNELNPFYRGKVAACRYFYRYELARISPLIDLLNSNDDTCVSTQADWF